MLPGAKHIPSGPAEILVSGPVTSYVSRELRAPVVVEGLEGRTPHRWAWHAYRDGAHAGETRYTGRRRTKWWTAFKSFQGRMDKEMKLKKARYPGPDIWLTEQGAVVARDGFTTPSWGTAQAGRTIKAYVNEGKYSLTEQNGPGGLWGA